MEKIVSLANDVLEEIYQLLISSNLPNKDSKLIGLIKYLLEQDNLDRARATVKMISNNENRIKAWLSIAKTSKDRKDIDKACEIVDNLPLDIKEMWLSTIIYAILEISQDFAWAQQVGQGVCGMYSILMNAVSLIKNKDALNVLRQLVNNEDNKNVDLKTHHFLHLAIVSKDLHDFCQAACWAKKVEDLQNKANLTRDIISCMINFGYLEQAEKILHDNISKDYDQSEKDCSQDYARFVIVNKIVDGLLRNQDKPDTAMTVAKWLREDPLRCGYLLKKIVEHLLKSGKIDQANQIAQNTEDDSSRDKIISSIIEKQLEIDIELNKRFPAENEYLLERKTDFARQRAEEIKDPYQRAQIRLTIGRIMRRYSDIEAIYQIANEVTSLSLRINLLFELVEFSKGFYKFNN